MTTPTKVALRRLAHLVTNCTDIGLAPLLNLESVESGTGRLVDGLEVPVVNRPETGAATVESGDVLFGKLRPYLAKSFRVASSAYASTELMAIRSGPLLTPRFLHYVVQSRAFVEWTTATSDGTKMPRTSWEKASQFVACLPQLPAQHAITHYLDTETARIDALIAKKRLMIELLVERFRSLVDEVTDTGPATSVKYLTTLITSGPRGWGDRVGESGQPFVRSANLQRTSIELRTENLARVDVVVTAEARRSQANVGDVVVGITGANTGWVGLVRGDVGPAFVSQHVALLRPAVAVDPTWLAYSIFSQRAQEALLAGQYGGTKQQLGLDDLAELRLPTPSVGIQQSIGHLIGDCAHSTKLLSGRIAAQIVALQEHRQALITAAVSGELEIPGFAA